MPVRGVAALLVTTHAASAEPLPAVTGDASHDPPIEVGLFTGAQMFHSSSLPRPESGLSFGLRVGRRVVRWLVIETELGFAPTSADDAGVLMFGWRARAVFQLPPDGLRGGDLRPLFTIGSGGITSSHASPMRSGQEIRIPLTDPDTDFVIDAGVGVKLTELGPIGLRLDVRAVMAPLAIDRFDTPDLELLLGGYGRFGGKPRPAAPPPEPEDSDPDRDQLGGEADQCPTEAEDKDEFEDTDGCPDPDNDQDQVADLDDVCPLDAEVGNGIDDDDGCPDVDDDGDGVLGSTDLCPAEAEDKDDFADTDGCPDFDNDSDGVVDGVDTCATELEAVNGFDDHDGCPDEVPREVLAIIGVVRGVTFDKRDEVRRRGRPARSKPLDAVAATLERFPSISIEIVAHGKGKGDPEAVLATTGRRAEAVKRYLVERGIDETRLTAVARGLEVPIGTRNVERIELVLGLSPGPTPEPSMQDKDPP